MAPLGRDGELACQTLTEAGLQCRLCRNVHDLHAQPTESYGAVLLTEEVLTDDTARALAAMLDAQPAWSTLPVTVLTGRTNRRAASVREGLAEALGTRQGIIFLERPVRVTTFVSVMWSAVLARQRQYELRDQLVARQNAEAHAQMLTEEMKHRIKNSLGLVKALASQTFRHARSVEESLAIFSARLQSMALAQDILTESNGDRVSLQELISRALEPYQQHDAPDRIAISGPEVWIGGRRSTSLTMAMHELATNSVKYGALSTESGQIVVCWRTEEMSNSKQLFIEWREQGGPPVTPPMRRGFGSRLVETGLAMEFGGTAKLFFEPGGVVCKIQASREHT